MSEEKKKPAPYIRNLGSNVINFEFDDGTSFSMYEDQAALMARTIYDSLEEWWDAAGFEGVVR